MYSISVIASIVADSCPVTTDVTDFRTYDNTRLF